MAQAPTPDEVKGRLKNVKYPGLSRDVVSLGVIKKIDVEGDQVVLILQFTTQDPAIKKQAAHEVRQAVEEMPGVAGVEIRTAEVESPADRGKKKIPGVENVIAVTSGKGGVGKSTVAVNLAAALHVLGSRVGIADADVYGPNIPIMMGVNQRPLSTPDRRLIPLEKHGIKVMSLGFFLEGNTPAIWRGPMIMQVVKQFLQGVDWKELDFLLVDMPPGTGDAQLTLVQTVPLSGAVVVTTPQDVALLDARKAVKMFQRVNAPIIGIVENMSYFLCPSCNNRTEVFSYGGGRNVSRLLGVPFLGEVPIDPKVRQGGDEGKPIVITEPDSPPARIFLDIASQILRHSRISQAASA